MAKRDDFFERYAHGTISSANEITTNELVAWFADNAIVAGVWTVNQKDFEFIVPVDSDREQFVVTVRDDGGIDSRLLVEQMAVLLAKQFSVDVSLVESDVYEADWSGSDEQLDVQPQPIYVVSKMPPESSIQAAHSLKQSIEYGSSDGLSIWRLAEPVSWFEHAVLGHELPLFAFEDSSVTVRYKTMSEPVLLAYEGAMSVSLPGDLLYHIEGTIAGEIYEEIKGYRARPGGEIDTLIAAGVIKKSQTSDVIDVIESCKERSEFVQRIGALFHLPGSLTAHIVDGTMPENTKVSKVLGGWKMFMKTAEEYSYEPDQNAGPLKKVYAYISRRPLFDWTFMIGEIIVGVIVAVLAYGGNAEGERLWWHYGLIVFGALLVIEGVMSVIVRLNRTAK